MRGSGGREKREEGENDDRHGGVGVEDKRRTRGIK